MAGLWIGPRNEPNQKHNKLGVTGDTLLLMSWMHFSAGSSGHLFWWHVAYARAACFAGT